MEGRGKAGHGSVGKKQRTVPVLHHAVVCVSLRKLIELCVTHLYRVSLMLPVLRRLYFCLLVLVTNEDYRMTLIL